jgi:hypothetical protein
MAGISRNGNQGFDACREENEKRQTNGRRWEVQGNQMVAASRGEELRYEGLAGAK